MKGISLVFDSDGEASVAKPVGSEKTTCIGVNCKHVETKSGQSWCPVAEKPVFELFSGDGCPNKIWYVSGKAGDICRDVVLSPVPKKRTYCNRTKKAA